MAKFPKTRASEESGSGLSGVGPLPVGVRTHVYDHVYRVLRHAVIIRSIPPGTRIVEATLATQLEVSRTPIRDALRRLEADGLLAWNHRKSPNDRALLIATIRGKCPLCWENVTRERTHQPTAERHHSGANTIVQSNTSQRRL